MSMRGVAAALLALSMAGNAQALYPDRPIRLFVAQSTGGNADTIYAEIVANLVPNAHLMAAGILAVNRAQERGYTLATA